MISNFKFHHYHRTADTTLTNITFTINGIDSNGNFEVNQVISQTNTTINNFDFKHHLAYKQFELTSYNGNVLATVLDRKTNNTADVVTAQHYYPFGIVMSSYKASGYDYKFSFNGKEKDNETYGEGNAYDFGARIYDSRLGKWLSVDPLVAKYPYVSPYSFCANNPIIYIDPDGKKVVLVGDQEFVNKTFAQLQTLTSNQLVLLLDGTVMEANKLSDMQKLLVVQTGKVERGNFVQRIVKPIGTKLVSDAIDDDNTITIQEVDDWNDESAVFDNQENSTNGKGSNSTIYHDPEDDGTKTEPKIRNRDGTTGRGARINLAHELIHALKGALGKILTGNSTKGDPDNLKPNGKTLILSNEEVDTRKEEQKISIEQGEPVRADPIPLD